jgi:hypothetical protein
MEAFFGHPEVTEQLIDTRANLDLLYKNEYTPLMITSSRYAAIVIGTSGTTPVGV